MDLSETIDAPGPDYQGGLGNSTNRRSRGVPVDSGKPGTVDTFRLGARQNLVASHDRTPLQDCHARGLASNGGTGKVMGRFGSTAESVGDPPER